MGIWSPFCSMQWSDRLQQHIKKKCEMPSSFLDKNKFFDFLTRLGLGTFCRIVNEPIEKNFGSRCSICCFIGSTALRFSRSRHVYIRRLAECNTNNLKLWSGILREIVIIFRGVTNDHSCVGHKMNKCLYKSEEKPYRETSLILLFPTFPSIIYMNCFLKSLWYVFLMNFWTSAKKCAPLGIYIPKSAIIEFGIYFG